MATKIRTYGVAVLTLVVLIGVAAWLFTVARNIDVSVSLAEDGRTVVKDPFTRSKDILSLILPLLTTLVGFWVGTKGTEEAKEETSKAKAQREAFKEVAKDKAASGEDIYELARDKRPTAFD